MKHFFRISISRTYTHIRVKFYNVGRIIWRQKLSTDARLNFIQNFSFFLSLHNFLCHYHFHLHLEEQKNVQEVLTMISFCRGNFNVQFSISVLYVWVRDKTKKKREKIILKNKDISFLTQQHNTDTHPQEYINLPLPTWKIAIRNVATTRVREREKNRNKVRHYKILINIPRSYCF